MASTAVTPHTPPSDVERDRINAYWRAANHLSVGQIYLLDNPLLREPLTPRHIKPRLLGHWGTTPGLNFVYVHLNRTIRERDLDMIYIAGPGHGGPGLVANIYLEGTYREVYPNVSEDVDGLRSRNYVNMIVAGKQPALQYLDMDAAIKHTSAGVGIWDWASNDQGTEPDVVMACCGDIPTLETLAAVDFLRARLPDLRIRVVNVVDLMVLQPEEEHPHGLTDRQFDTIFTTDRPIIFAFHGYPWLIHRLTYRRTNHDNLHVRGYKEEGTTTTPFDMAVMNDLDRYHLAIDAIDRIPGLAVRAAYVTQEARDLLTARREYVREYGDDPPEIKEWTWPG
jgi:phosphoketolase